MHCHTPWGQWAVGFPQYTASLLLGSGNPVTHCDSAQVQWPVELLQLLRCLGAVGSATHGMYYHAAWGRQAVELLQCTTLAA